MVVPIRSFSDESVEEWVMSKAMCKSYAVVLVILFFAVADAVFITVSFVVFSLIVTWGLRSVFGTTRSFARSHSLGALVV
jgi:hypothetical protein